MAVVHSKVDQIPDWAQQQLNEQIALGNYPNGTTLADIVLPSDWNDGHNIDVTTYQTETDAGDAVSQLAMNMRAAMIVDMGNDNYTLTDSEAQASGLIIVNSGSGKTLTYPTSANYKSGAIVAVIMAFAANPISVVHASAGSAITINNPAVDYVAIATGVGVSRLSSAFVSDTAYASTWSGVDYSAPSKNAVYDALVGPSPNEAFIAQYADRTLTSTTSLQKLFDATTNGAYTVDSDTAYWFECQFVMSTMGSTSGNLQFDVLGAGTATIDSTAWSAYGRDAGAYNNPGTTAGCFTESKVSTGDIVSAGTGSGMFAKIEGILRITTGGTLIPSVALTNAAAATLKANSYFKIRKIGAAAVTSAGAWS